MKKLLMIFMLALASTVSFAQESWASLQASSYGIGPQLILVGDSDAPGMFAAGSIRSSDLKSANIMASGGFQTSRFGPNNVFQLQAQLGARLELNTRRRVYERKYTPHGHLAAGGYCYFSDNVRFSFSVTPGVNLYTGRVSIARAQGGIGFLLL